MGLNVGKLDPNKVLGGVLDATGNLKVSQEKSISATTLELILDELEIMNSYNAITHGIKLTKEDI